MRGTLQQFQQARYLQNLPAGEYFIEYNDSTHLSPTEWVKLVTLDVQRTAIPAEDSSTDQYYTLTKNIENLPNSTQQGDSKRVVKGSSESSNEGERRIRVIEDTLALALGRVGLLVPKISQQLLQELLRLYELEGVVIVPDTNALHNGAIHWLLRVLNRHPVWLMPVVASMTTIQTRDAIVKGLVNKCKIGNLNQALRSRGLVNGALGLLERNRGRCQVVEIDPSLLRYQKMASSSGTDPDQGDVLEDRLIIEAIHGVLRTMRTRTARRVVTSDVHVARILVAEGIDVLFVPTITMKDTAISCLRYDALARVFVGAPLRVLVWELAHAFGSVRLVKNQAHLATLECYWKGKTPDEWASETLVYEFEQTMEVIPRHKDIVNDVSDTSSNNEPISRERLPTLEALAEPEPARNTSNATTEDVQSHRKAVQPAAKTAISLNRAKRLTPIVTELPRASLPQMLRLLGSAQRLGQSTAESIVAGMRHSNISVDKARRPLEILRRMHLIEHVENTYRPTNDAELVEAALRTSDLDSLNSLMERFKPYRLFLETLKARGEVKRTEVASIVHDLVGSTGVEESTRLPRFHILLGQAWTSADSIMDGSQRTTDRDATDAFHLAFREKASDGIAQVLDLLPRFCALTRSSPWAAKLQIGRFIATRVLQEYNFQPAAGTKPVFRDEVISGTLDDAAPEPVVIDRIYLGEQPIFTVEGPSR